MTGRREQMVQKVAEAIDKEFISGGESDTRAFYAEAIAKIAVDTILAQPTHSTVDIVKEEGQPTTCEVRIGDMVIFRGRDYSEDLVEPSKRGLAT